MNVLLDTCALLALAGGDLPDRAAAALLKANEAHVSSVTGWEVAIKVAAGKLRLTESPAEWFAGMLDRYELLEAPVVASVASASALLPPIHRDPFDRVIVALAQARGLIVLTSDEHIRRYPGIATRW